MTRIGYAPGAFDLFHVGHVNLLRSARNQCDFLIAGVVSDEILLTHKGRKSVIPLIDRLEIVRSCRYVDQAVPAMDSDKIDIWQTLKFDILFKGDDWSGTPAGDRLEHEFAMVGVEVIYFPYTAKVSTTALRANFQPLVGKIGEAPAGARSVLEVRSSEIGQ